MSKTHPTLCAKLITAISPIQGHNGQFEPGKFQYSTPTFFDWLFLIRAYWNPKYRQQQLIIHTYNIYTVMHSKLDFMGLKVFFDAENCFHPSMLSLETNGWTRLEGEWRSSKFIYFSLSSNHTGVNTPISKNGSPFISVKLGYVVLRLLVQN